MIISGKYELNQALLESNFQSFHARHIVTGREVMVHLLTGPNDPSLPAMMASLSAEQQAQVLDAGEYEGTSYLVTAPIAGFTTLRGWFGGLAGAAGSAPPQLGQTARLTTPARGAGKDAASEFTDFFGAVPAAAASGSPAAAPAAPKPVEGSGSAGDSISFTQLFQQQAPPSPVPPPAQSSRPTPPNFTPAPVGTSAVTSFSDLLKGQSSGGGPAPRPASPPPAPAPSVRTPSGTSFTEIFRQTPGGIPAATPPGGRSTPGGGNGAGEFTQFFQLPEQPSRPPQPMTPPPPNPAPAPQPFPVVSKPREQGGVGEFTEFFRGPDAASPFPGSVQRDLPPQPFPASAPPITGPRQAPPLPPPPSAPPGGATEFFRVPPPAGPATPASQPPASGGGGLSEFTLIMGGGGNVSGGAKPGMGSTPSSPTPAAPPAWPAFPPVSAPPAPAVAPLPKLPAPPPIPAAPGKPAWSLVLVAVLSALLTGGFLAIVYLVSRGGR